MSAKKPEHPSSKRGFAIFGTHDAQTLDQFFDVVSRAYTGALMADGHVGYIMPIGGVVAYENRVSVAGVGFDIGCGNLAVRLDCTRDGFDLKAALDLIEGYINFGVGSQNAHAPADHPVFSRPEWNSVFPNRDVAAELLGLGREQLGSVGAGNHYVDIFRDEGQNIWIGVHFGSRGLGHKIASGFLNLSQKKKWGDRVFEKEVLLDLSTSLGQAYFGAMELAGAYAKAGREWVCAKIVSLLGAKVTKTVHNHHNFAWRETHFGKDLIVIRKGATPAFEGQQGFVGGSMGDNAVIVEGVDTPQSRRALFSTVHGAGRVMSRIQAAGKFKGFGKKRRCVKPGAVSRGMMHEWLEKAGVELRGGEVDESPHAYRRLDEVIKAQKNTVRVVHTLTPIGVVMAGRGLRPHR